MAQGSVVKGLGSENLVPGEEITGTSGARQESEISFDFNDSCKCTNVYQCTGKESLPMTSMPIKLQIVIMSSKVWALNKLISPLGM